MTKTNRAGTCRAACTIDDLIDGRKRALIDDLIDGRTEGKESVGPLALSMTSLMDASGHYR